MATRRELLIYQVVASGEKQFIADLTTIQKLIQEHQKVAEQSGKAIADAIAKESSAVADLIRQQNELQRTAQTTRQAQLDGQKEATKAAQDARTATQAQTQAIKDSNAQYGAMKDQLTGLVGLAASVFSVNAIKNYAMDVIDAKTKVDLFSLSLTSMIGNKKKADEIAAQVFEIAKKSPFEVEQLITVTQKLKAMGVETDKLIPYIKALGDISAFVGTDKLPFMAKAMVDVQNKGKLMAQEINQFSNAGVPLFDLLAKSMGKTKEAVIEMAKEHTISFAMVEKAILGATEKGGAYYNGMANSAKTLGGQVSNLSDLFFLGKAKIGDYFENGLQKGITIMGDFLKATIGSNSSIQRTITGLEAGLAIWLSYKVAVIATSASLKVNQVATLEEMGAATLANATRKTSIANLYAQLAGNTALTAAQRTKMMGQILDMEAEIAANVVKTTSVGVTTSLTGAMHGLNLAIRANPWGFLVSAIGLAIGAYQTYKALNTEVQVVESEQINMLNKTKAGFDAMVGALANTNVGTKERSTLVAQLQIQYPGYIKNIDLETATQQDLAKMLNTVNGQMERKIKLATQEAFTETFKEKAIDLGKKQLAIVNEMREKYPALSKEYIDNASFLGALNKKAKESIDITSSGSMGQNVMTSTNVALRKMLDNYTSVNKEIVKTTKDMSQSLNETSKLSANDLKAQSEQFAKELKERQFDLNRLRDIGVLNDKKYKEQWNLAVADYKKDIKSLSNEQIKTNETTLNTVGGDTKKANKAKAENYSLTAKEINLIEAHANAKRLDMTKDLSKDELKVLKDLAKAEYDVDVEKLQKKYKANKDGKEKISAEMIKLDQTYFNKLEKVDADYQKKKTENDRKQSELRFKYRDAEQEKNDRKELSELEEKLLKQAKKELSEAEKLDDQLEKLNKEFRESQARLEDAQNLKRELATAKTATERYAITVKYGKKTNDELLAMEIVRMQKEQKRINDRMIALAKENKQNTDEYKKLQEEYLRLSTDINNKISGVISKQADETLRTYDRLYKFYQKHLNSILADTARHYEDIQKYNEINQRNQTDTLRDSYELQTRFLGDNLSERLKLTDEFSKKEIALLDSQNRTTQYIENMKNITNAVSNSLTKQLSLWNTYHTTIETNSKTIADKQDLHYANGAATAKFAMATVGNFAGQILGIMGKNEEFALGSEIKVIDAKRTANKRYYDEVLIIAKENRDAKIKAIQEEEDYLLKSLDNRYQMESQAGKAKLSINTELVDNETKVLLAQLEDRHNLEIGTTEQKVAILQDMQEAEIILIEGQRDRVLAAETKKSGNYIQGLQNRYNAEILAANGNADKIKEINSTFGKDLIDAKIQEGTHLAGVELFYKKAIIDINENYNTQILDLTTSSFDKEDALRVINTNKAIESNDIQRKTAIAGAEKEYNGQIEWLKKSGLSKEVIDAESVLKLTKFNADKKAINDLWDIADAAERKKYQDIMNTNVASTEAGILKTKTDAIILNEINRKADLENERVAYEAKILAANGNETLITQIKEENLIKKATINKIYDEENLIAEKNFQDAMLALTNISEAARIAKIEESREIALKGLDDAQVQAEEDAEERFVFETGENQKSFDDLAATLLKKKNEAIANKDSTGKTLQQIEDDYNAAYVIAKGIFDAANEESSNDLYLKIKNAKEIHLIDIRDTNEKYDKQIKDKTQQYEDEKADIIKAAEKKKKDLVLTAEQDRLQAMAINEQRKEGIITASNNKLLSVNDEYNLAIFKADQEFTAKDLAFQRDKMHKEAEIQKAKIRNSFGVAAAKILEGDPTQAIGSILSGLFSSYDPAVEIGKQEQSAHREFESQIALNSARSAPVKLQRPTDVEYLRTPYQLASPYSTTNVTGLLRIANNGGTPMPDFNANPDAGRNHETPIDYIDYLGARYAVYDWTGNNHGGVIYYSPRLERRFKDGTSYIERGRSKMGVDQIPAMIGNEPIRVNEGERILTTEQNQQLGGKNKPNEQIVKEVQLAEFVMKNSPSLMNIFMKDGGMPRMRMDEPRQVFNDKEMIKAVQSLEETLKNKKTSNVNVTVDKYNVSVEEQRENSRIKYHNAIYNRNHPN